MPLQSHQVLQLSEGCLCYHGGGWKRKNKKYCSVVHVRHPQKQRVGPWEPCGTASTSHSDQSTGMGLQPGNTWVPCIYSQGIDILYAASPALCMFEHLKSLLLFLLSGGLGFHSVSRIITLLFPFHTLYQGMAHGASRGSSVRLWEREV